VVRTHSRIQTPAELVEQSRPAWPEAGNAVLRVIVWWTELLPSYQARRKMEGTNLKLDTAKGQSATSHWQPRSYSASADTRQLHRGSCSHLCFAQQGGR
jgi:hypothetical protein